MVLPFMARACATLFPTLRPTYGVQVTMSDGLGQVLVLPSMPKSRTRDVLTEIRVMHMQLQATVTVLRLPPWTCPLVDVNPVMVFMGADPDDRLLAPEQILALMIRTPILRFEVSMRLMLLKLTLQF